MRTLLLTLISLNSLFLFSQTVQLEATINAKDLPPGTGKAVVYSLSDSTLVKGNYIDSSSFTAQFDRNGQTDFFLKISAPGFSDTTINFNASEGTIDLGEITLVSDLNLDEVKVTYVKPMFERTMDGIKVNVDGTTLQQLNTLFDVLKASPRLTSPDEESIEIIGRGSPLIRIDRQAIISNDELKAIPASQVDRIEINTNPSSKYKAQGSGNGVIEVYTKNYSLEGYRVSISANGGLSTQLKPGASFNTGVSLKKKKFTLSAYLGGNYSSANSYGYSDANTTDGTNRSLHSEFEANNAHTWQYYNVKGAYELKEKHRLAMGVHGYGSGGKWDNTSNSSYYSGSDLTTSKDELSSSKFIWQNNSAFMNYSWETDTFNSVLEVNLNYINKISESNGSFFNDFIDHTTGNSTAFNVRNNTHDRPNVGEMRINYEHHFDTTNWELNVGGAYSMLINGKRFDRENYIGNDWIIDPVYSNSYDYQEHIGGLFAEVSNKWEKFGFRVGLRGEYTRLDGYSNSLDKQFMDSTYILPFPSASFMFSPNDTIAITLFYKSGIDRPQFDNYDPFVIIEDSLNIQYGNPFLRPAREHTIGIETDLFSAFNLSLSYTYIKDPQSTVSFVNDSSFVTERTPWNADYQEEYSASLSLPIQLSWLQGWNTFWFDYQTYVFTEEFGRSPFHNPTFGFYSYLNFILPKKFNISNNFSLNKWGNAEMTTNVNYNWSIRVTKKFLDNDLQIYADASYLAPIKNRNYSYSGNYEYTSVGQYRFTIFKLGVYYKFGRLKAPTNIKESSSGQSNRI